MTYYADADQRARLIAGLHGLAAFLETNPDLPAPLYADVLVFPPDWTDAEQRTEIEVIAARLSGKAAETVCGHYVVSQFFGPVQYRAVAIPRDGRADRD